MKLTGVGAHLAAICALLIWSSTHIVNKLLFNAAADPLVLLVSRETLAVCCLFLLAPRFRPWPGWKQALRRDRYLIAAGVVGMFIYYLFDNYAVQNTYVTNFTLIITTSPILSALLSRYVDRSGPLGRRFLLGTALCIVGAAFVIFNGTFVLRLSPRGDLLTVGASVCWALYSFLLNRGLQENAQTEQPLSLLQFTRNYMAIGALLMWALFFATGHTAADLLHLGGAFYGSAAYLAVFSSCIAMVLWGRANSRLGTVVCSLYLYTSPLLGILASHLFLQERMTPVAVLGAVLILGGMAIIQFHPARAAKAHPLPAVAVDGEEEGKKVQIR